jgi:hypothetical protein
VAVVFKLSIQKTPIAGAPIQINADTKITDKNGEVSADLRTTSLYAISSGLEAVSFVPLLETGTSFAQRSPVALAAERLISTTQQPCRLVMGGAPYLYFESTNTSDKSLEVPLRYSPLNSMYSVTGQAIPPELFAPGTSGYTVLESHFVSGTARTGRWRFLGQEIVVPTTPSVCADRGVPGACTAIDQETLRLPFTHARRIIMKLINLSLAASRTGRWKPTGGSFTNPFLSRGATALKMMEGVFSDSLGQNFRCELTPLSCTTKEVPKKALVKAFKKIFEGKVPRGLEHVIKTAEREIASFERLLRKLPDRYTSCQ